MKKIFKYILLASGAAMALSACTESVIDDLSGVYPAPTEVALSSLTSSDAVKADGIRTFTIQLAGSSQVTLALVGNSYFLTPNTYSPAEASLAKNGNYILGQTTVDGKAVTSGSAVISKSGDAKNYSESDVYTLDAMFFCSDGTPYRVKWSGNLLYEPDPEPVKLTQVFQAQSNLGNGVASVTLSLASADVGYSYDAATWTTTYTGDGNYLAIDLYSADGYLHEGTYTASAVGGTIGEGEFGIGYDTEFWGMQMYNWGTCWWTVSGGATSAEKITSGTITVSKSGSRWNIEWGSEETYPNWAVFSGAIDDLTAPSEGGVTVNYHYSIEKADVTDATYQPVSGIKSNNVTVVDEDGKPVAMFALILAEDVDEIEGTYTVAEYAAEAYLASNGWSFGEWSGGSWYSGADGSRVNIQPDEVITVKKLAEGAYEITGTSGYDYKIGDDSYTLGGDTVTASYTYSIEKTTVSDASYQPVEGVMTNNVSLFDGEGNAVAMFALILAADVDEIEGTFTVAEYASEAYLASNGWSFGDWSGGSWYAGEDGSRVNIQAEEVITVKKHSEGLYTFSLSSGKSYTAEAKAE